MIPYKHLGREMVDRRFVLLACWLMVSTFARAQTIESGEANVEFTAGNVIVVCPPLFRAALEPWIRQRQGERLQIRVIDSAPTAVDLQASIRRHAASDNNYVVLVGDAPSVGKVCDVQRQIPTFYAASPIAAQWGSTPTAASDLALGDLDGDGQADAAVGRFPVVQPEQLSGLVKRILDYEHSSNFGPWRGQVQLTGGIGGFGMFVDAAIESVTRTLVTSSLPTEIKTTVAYASPGHLFYPKSQSFTDEVLARYQRGSRFWVYAGHGWIDSLDRVPQTREGVPVLDGESVGRMRIDAGVAPIGLLLACYTGAFDAPQQSLAERMLLTPAGPVAVFAGSRMTMPYGNTVTAVGLIDGVYRDQCHRLGDAWLATLRMLDQPDSGEKTQTRILIDSLAGMISPAGTVLADERREHAAIYNLLGDPTLNLHHPQTITIAVPTGSSPSDPVLIEVQSPIDGELYLSLDRPLGGVTEGDPNDTTIASVETQVTANETHQHRVLLPAGFQGPLIIRALVRGTGTWATAATRTLIR